MLVSAWCCSFQSSGVPVLDYLQLCYVKVWINWLLTVHVLTLRWRLLFLMEWQIMTLRIDLIFNVCILHSILVPYLEVGHYWVSSLFLTVPLYLFNISPNLYFSAENPATMVNCDPERPYQFDLSDGPRRPHTTYERSGRTSHQFSSPLRPPRTAPGRLSKR